MQIPLAHIAFDAGTQIRVAIDPHVVTDYAESMTSGAVFPPIVLFHDGNQHYLADGFHRFLAAQRIQARTIDADVQAGTKDDALWFAIGANRTNGKRLTEADKTHAVTMALDLWPNKMQREIADQVGCSQSLVSRVAQDVTNNTGVEPVLRGRALVTQTKRDAIRAMVSAGAQSIDIRRELKAHSVAIADVRREMGLSGIDYSRKAVKARRARIREMAESGHTSRQIAAELGLTEEGCREIIGKEQIHVPADKVMRGLHKHDSTRIMEHIVMDADNLTADVNLIDFSSLQHDQIAAWIASLNDSRDKLGAFIRRLMKEQQNHEAA